MASTCSPCWFWKDIRAPLVTVFSEPSIHWDVKSGGSPGQRQAKVPGCAVARSAGGVVGSVGVKVSGR